MYMYMYIDIHTCIYILKVSGYSVHVHVVYLSNVHVLNGWCTCSVVTCTLYWK